MIKPSRRRLLMNAVLHAGNANQLDFFIPSVTTDDRDSLMFYDRDTDTIWLIQATNRYDWWRSSYDTTNSTARIQTGYDSSYMLWTYITLPPPHTGWTSAVTAGWLTNTGHADYVFGRYRRSWASTISISDILYSTRNVYSYPDGSVVYPGDGVTLQARINAINQSNGF